MKKEILLLLSLSTFCYADPFYADPKPDSDEMPAINGLNPTACQSTSTVNRVHLASPFEQFKLIGLIQLDNEFRALFIDNNKQLVDLKSQDFIEEDNIEIQNVDLKLMTYIDWKRTNHCHNPYLVTLKL